MKGSPSNIVTTTLCTYVWGGISVIWFNMVIGKQNGRVHAPAQALNAD